MKSVSNSVMPVYGTSPTTIKIFGLRKFVRLGSCSRKIPCTNLKCNSIGAGFYQSALSDVSTNSDNLSLNTNKESTRHIRTLLIDNYDSYTYNIYQQLSTINGVPPKVIYNDEWTWDHIHHYLYKEKAFDNIVISPGPGSPDCSKDMGVCLRVLLECEDIPILGVCLGHQALAYVHGARIIHAPIPAHGRLSEITHNSCSLFRDIPSGCNSGFKVVRYHSLIIDAGSLPCELIPIAWTSSTNGFGVYDMQNNDICGVSGAQNGLFVSQRPLTTNAENLQHTKNFDAQKQIIMGVMHTSRAHYGVQFHPESVATYHGRKIFENFKKITLDRSQAVRGFDENKVPFSSILKGVSPFQKFQDINAVVGSNSYHSKNTEDTDKRISGRHFHLKWKKFDSLEKKVGGSSNIFLEIFGQQKAKDTFWLDSASTDLRKARFSFMGSKGGSLWKQYTFWLTDKSKNTGQDGGYLTIEDSLGSVETKFLADGFFSFLKKELQAVHYDKKEYEGLPFDFCGGYIGFLGYDLKSECSAQFNLHSSKTPDACFFFADNLVVVDHQNDDVYLLSLQCTNQSEGSVINDDSSWMGKMEERLLLLEECGKATHMKEEAKNPTRTFCNEEFRADKSRDLYLKDIKNCQEFIKDGESYELCLTTRLRKKVEGTEWLDLYLNLREKNPAPYAAWLNFSREDLSICCSSPERFLRLDRNDILEAKPIKGTIARGLSSEEDERLKKQLQYSEKDQAENLMIVDLLRNDLGRVCDPGSVHVPRLMEVETYATVHTMVSTIRGKKSPESCPIDCVKAAFPGGSMTGAPKIRSMELLDSMENSSRGVYSGCIGYFSYNQRFDLNIVIRSVVIHKGEATVGAGGAITALSVPEDEYEEMMLKAQTPMKVVMDNQR